MSARGGKSGGLARYREMRDFARTPEPKGGRREAQEPRLRYVVQRHDATRLHYDFRLEHDGVLKSWAVPKEPSLDPKERRLAVQTEDHPLEYGGFEGEIPEGEYGAGSVVIWDRGFWVPLGDAERALADGKLDFELAGERLRGRFTLVRMARHKRRERAVNWLLIKRHDRGRPAKPARARSRGAAVTPRASAPFELPGAVAAELPRRFAVQLATAVARPPESAGWFYEPKLDGYRLLCRVEAGEVTLLTRRGLDWTERFPAIAAAARELSCDGALIDGEAVVLDATGVSSFQKLQNALAVDPAVIVLVAFDLLHLNGIDLTRVPLVDRKRLLEQWLGGRRGAIRYGEHVDANGAAFFAAACRLGLEGILAKRSDAPYRQGRGRSWLKVKCMQRQEFVLVGFTDPAGSRTGFGALLVGTRTERHGPLRYAGKVGTGFDERLLRSLAARLKKLERREPPIESTRHVQKRGVHWVHPELVAEIAFKEWTDDERLRQPVFQGLREDKPAAEVVVERPVTDAAAPRSRAASTTTAAAKEVARPKRAVRLTHPDKVLFPDPGITKRQLADYWRAVAGVALPLIAGRPLTLFRCPEGYGSACFYQKHVGVGVPATVPRVAIDPDEDPYAAIDDADSLVALVQIGVIELHVWGSRVDDIERPDIIVFDLDPAPDVAWPAVVEGAFDVKSRLERLGLEAFAKLTGGKGLHVVVPVVPGPTWPAVKRFARALVEEMVRAQPKRYVASMAKSRRAGKIFVDYLRNDREATAIGAYSPRARAGAPVALPIEWGELDAAAEAAPRFGLLEIPRLVQKRRRDPWAGFEAARRPIE